MDEGGEAARRGFESLKRVTVDERIGGALKLGRHGMGME